MSKMSEPGYYSRFKGLQKKHFELAFDDWDNFAPDSRAFAKTVPGAGPPRTRFIIRGKGIPAPLKAIVKKAMTISGNDPQSGEHWFNPDIAEKWLSSQNWGYIFFRKNPSVSEEFRADEGRHAAFVRVLSRPEQAKFRLKVLIAYDCKCAISGCQNLAALEAAHIVSKKDKGSDNAKNGILLRADLHRLFDANLLKISPYNGQVVLDESLSDHYSLFDGEQISTPPENLDFSVFGNRWKDAPLKEE